MKVLTMKKLLFGCAGTTDRSLHKNAVLQDGTVSRRPPTIASARDIGEDLQSPYVVPNEVQKLVVEA